MYDQTSFRKKDIGDQVTEEGDPSEDENKRQQSTKGECAQCNSKPAFRTIVFH